ncbi:hypothetical protein IQ07DRAFT_664084 [Pyrenochaeta sp. DS3sAY3a]|nr:hypothetical protein IQ07DRAFT_664084 [Pyrenochaeta sp. DS3sAY3a]
MLLLYILTFLPTLLFLVLTTILTTIDYALQARLARSPIPSSPCSPPTLPTLPWYTSWLPRLASCLPFANRRTILITDLRTKIAAAERKARDAELAYGVLEADTSALQRMNSFLADEALAGMRLQTRVEVLQSQNSGLRTRNAALIAQNNTVTAQNSALHTAQMDLENRVGELENRAGELARKADASEASAYELQMQVQYKCAELVGVTSGWEACRREVRALEDLVERERGERRGEVESWRGNSAATIHALHSQIAELTTQRDGLDVAYRQARALLEQARQGSRSSGYRDRATSTSAYASASVSVSAATTEPWTASDSDTETLADVDEGPEWTDAEWGMYVDIEVLEGVEVGGLESDEEV